MSGGAVPSPVLGAQMPGAEAHVDHPSWIIHSRQWHEVGPVSEFVIVLTKCNDKEEALGKLGKPGDKCDDSICGDLQELKYALPLSLCFRKSHILPLASYFHFLDSKNKIIRKWIFCLETSKVDPGKNKYGCNFQYHFYFLKEFKSSYQDFVTILCVLTNPNMPHDIQQKLLLEQKVFHPSAAVVEPSLHCSLPGESDFTFTSPHLPYTEIPQYLCIFIILHARGNLCYLSNSCFCKLFSGGSLVRVSVPYDIKGHGDEQK